MKVNKGDIKYLGRLEYASNLSVYSRISRSIVVGVSMLVIPFSVLISAILTFLLIEARFPEEMAIYKDYYHSNLKTYFFIPLIIIVGIISLVIMVSVFINLYTTISYSVAKRSRYYGMLLALGIRVKDIQKIYSCSIMHLFAKSFKKSFFIGGSICLVVFLAFDAIMNRIANGNIHFFVFQIEQSNSLRAIFLLCKPGSPLTRY